MTILTVNQSITPKQRFVDANGNALNGGKLFTYAAGTTNKQATYTDSTGNTANANPIILNSRGECDLWLDQTLAYKFTLSPSTDTDPPTNAIWTVDQVQPVSTFDQVQEFTPNVIGTVAGTNTITGVMTPTLGDYAGTEVFQLTPANNNTGATTLNIDGLGAKNVFLGGLACSGGELLAGVPVLLAYDGTQFNIISGVGTNLGTGTGKMTSIGVLSNQINTAGVGNGADATDDTLFTYSLPLNSLSANGKAVKCKAWGTLAANGNTKTITPWFAGVSLLASGITTNNGQWVCEWEVVRVDSTHVMIISHQIVSVTPIVLVNLIANQVVADLTANASVIKITGKSGSSAASDIIGYGMIVWGEN